NRPWSNFMRPLIGLLAVAILLLSFGAPAKAQNQPATCADWFAVQSWTGVVTYSGSGSGSDQNGNTEELSESATINFTTEKNSSPCDVNGDFGNGLAITGWMSAPAK